MEYKALSPRKSLNKAFLKVKPNRSDVERFKTGLVTLLDRINLNESEEFHKNLLSDFLDRINVKALQELLLYYLRERGVEHSGFIGLPMYGNATA